ncbi:hypothetical protein BC829DRAFT_388890 [Chytridium lagenaria]|nr:hypothetical protein BC829DRAFT_388890 [Chytridium lagenaria]
MWDTIGYLLLLRSTSHTAFYASLFITLLYNALYQIGNAIFLRRQMRKRIDVENIDLLHSPKVLDLGERGKGVENNERNPNQGVFAQSFTPSAKERNWALKAKEKARNPNGFEGKGKGDEAVTARDSILQQSTRRNPAMLPITKENVEERQEPEQASDTITEINANHAEVKKTENVRTTRHSLPLPSNSDSDSSSRADASAFIPLSPSIKYAFFRIGSLYTNWLCFLSASSIILLFVTLPDAPQWSGTYYDVPPYIFAIRFSTGCILCVVADVVALYFEARILCMDFVDGVNESACCVMSVGAFVHLIGLISSVAGAFIVADAFYSSPTYIVGRKRW